jgi:hypothetical protein
MTVDTAPNNNGTALATREPNNLGLHLVVSLDDLRLQLRELEQFKRDIMVQDVDYGTIPGTPKPTLLKPGAEKLSLAFGLAPTFHSVNRVEDWERGFFHYEERCDLVSKRTGEIVACASGSANSKEPRYRWRDAKPSCLNCGKDLRRSRNRDGDQGEPGWYCWTRMGGCGATYPAAQITGPIGRVENPEPYELVNTILKMAQKRALVAATLIATGGSGIWTQDLEDLPPDEDNVIDVPPRRAPFTPTREREVSDAPRTSDMVTSADESLWKRWLALKGEAEGLGIRVTEQKLPISRATLTEHGIKVADGIRARRDQLAEQDAAAREQDDKAPRQAPEPPVDHWARNRALVQKATELGIQGLPPTLGSRSTQSVIEQANADLAERIRSFEAELVEPGEQQGEF